MSDNLAGFGLRFHHMSLAVRAPEAAVRFLGALGYQRGATAFDPLQNVTVAMRLHPAMPDVEVIWPGVGLSPIDNSIRRGFMIYHLCYVPDDATASLDAMAAGLEVAPIGEPTAAVLFGGVPVSFHSIDQIGIIELIHGAPRDGAVA